MKHMSVTAGLIRYPADVLVQARAKGEFYPANGRDIQQCFLDRSWEELHSALRTFGPPLSLALTGDYGFEGGLDRFGWDETNTRDHYVGFVSPLLVVQIADRMRGVTFEQLATKLTEPSRGATYIATRFQEMVELYMAAAAGGDCIFVHVA
jgi:hypothetical protein